MRWRGKVKAKASWTREFERMLMRDEVLRVGDSEVQHVLYAFSFPSHPRLLKIGYTSRGSVRGGSKLPRVMEQTTGYPETPVLRLIVHSPHARHLEAMVHASLSSRRCYGGGGPQGREWFEVSIAEVIESCAELRTLVAQEDERAHISRMKEADALVGAWSKTIAPWLERQGALAWNDAVSRRLRTISEQNERWHDSFLSDPPNGWRANLKRAEKRLPLSVPEDTSVEVYDPRTFRRREPPRLDDLFLNISEQTVENRLIERMARATAGWIVAPMKALAAELASLRTISILGRSARADIGATIELDRARARAALDRGTAQTLGFVVRGRRALFGLDGQLAVACPDCDELFSREPVLSLDDPSGACPDCRAKPSA